MQRKATKINMQRQNAYFHIQMYQQYLIFNNQSTFHISNLEL